MGLSCDAVSRSARHGGCFPRISGKIIIGNRAPPRRLSQPTYCLDTLCLSFSPHCTRLILVSGRYQFLPEVEGDADGQTMEGGRDSD